MPPPLDAEAPDAFELSSATSPRSLRHTTVIAPALHVRYNQSQPLLPAPGKPGKDWVGIVMFPGSHPVVTDLVTSSRRRFLSPSSFKHQPFSNLKSLKHNRPTNSFSHDFDGHFAPQVCRHRFARLADGTCSLCLCSDFGYQVISYQAPRNILALVRVSEHKALIPSKTCLDHNIVAHF